MDAPNSSPHQEKEGDQRPREFPILDEKDKSKEILTMSHWLTFPAARLVRLYRRLWESCVSKHIDFEKLEQEHLVVKEAGTHLRKERDGLQVRHDKQLFG
ncbi:hypothetical protein MYU51_018643 [Penicillium brevicompactum]